MVDIEFLRNSATGYIGGPEVAKKANDEEIEWLANVQDRIVELDREITELRNLKNQVIELIKKDRRWDSIDPKKDQRKILHLF